MLKHYVFIRYRPDTPPEHADTFRRRMLALRESIPEIQSIEIGLDEFGEERSWSLILSMTFETVAALRHYQAHPEHVAAMQFNAPYVAEVGSVDYHQA